MNEDRSRTYRYRRYTIRTLRDGGGWGAKAGPTQGGAGGERAVQGGPWRRETEARAAAEAFCNRGKAG